MSTHTTVFKMWLFLRLNNNWKTRKPWYNSVWSKRPGNWVTGVKYRSLKAQYSGAAMSEGKRRWIAQLKENLPVLDFFAPFMSQVMEWCQPILLRVNFFTQSTESNAEILFRKYSRGISRNSAGRTRHPLVWSTDT